MALQPDMSMLNRISSPTATIPAVPAPLPNQGAVNPFLRSSLPLALTTQPDVLRQFYQGGVPQYRITPTLQNGIRITI